MMMEWVYFKVKNFSNVKCSDENSLIYVILINWLINIFLKEI